MSHLGLGFTICKMGYMPLCCPPHRSIVILNEQSGRPWKIVKCYTGTKQGCLHANPRTLKCKGLGTPGLASTPYSRCSPVPTPANPYSLGLHVYTEGPFQL